MKVNLLVNVLTLIAVWNGVHGRVASSTTTADQDEKLMRKEHEIPRNTLYIHDTSGVLEPTPSPDQDWIAQAVAASNVDVFTEPEEIAASDCDMNGEESKITHSEVQEDSPIYAVPSLPCPDSYTVLYHTVVNCTMPGSTAEVSPEQPVAHSSDIHETFSTRNQTSTGGAVVVLGEGNGVTYLDLDTGNTKVLNYTNLKVLSVGWHRSNGAVFLAAGDKITSTQNENPVVVSGGVEGSVRLAVDWLHDKLYWMTDKHQTVEVANLNGTERSTLVDTGLNFTYPNNIAVDPYQSFLFLVSNNSIYRSDLRGGNMTVLYSKRRVRSLTVDVDNKKVYFSRKEPSGRPYVSSMDYEGRILEDLALGDVTTGDIFSLDIFQNTLYFAHFTNNIDSLLTLELSAPSVPIKKYESSADRGGIWSIKVYQTVGGHPKQMHHIKTTI